MARRLLSFLLAAGVLGLCAAPPAIAGLQFQSAGVSATKADGSPDLQAGSHPFQLVTTYMLGGGARRIGTTNNYDPPEDLKDLGVNLPPGFVGDPNATPKCTAAEFETRNTNVIPESATSCPPETAVGVAKVYLGTTNGEEGEEPNVVSYAAVYNMEAGNGYAAVFAFKVKSDPVFLDTTVRNGEDYGVTTTAHNLPTIIPIWGATVKIWGVPAEASHDAVRGYCVQESVESHGSCPVSLPHVPLLTDPTSCGVPLTASFSLDTWENPATTVTKAAPMPELAGCERLDFSPSITAQPTTKAAQSPTGLDFSLDDNDEGLTSPSGLAGSQIRQVIATLPEGMTVNPSSAEGLAVCTEADLQRETLAAAPGEGCPEASKLGTIEVETPLLEEKLTGAMFLAKPYENPTGSLIALYFVIENPNPGIIVKQTAKVELDPQTGQLVTTTEEMPRLPFSHFRLHFKEGARSPLVSPPACGAYDGHPGDPEPVSAALTPWSGTSPVTATSAFQIISGPDNSPCPSGGTPPFHPALTAGTINNAAGSYSPFYVRLSRTDAEQEITHFSIKLPPGVTGKLAGIPFCPEADIAAARSRERTEHGGQEELEHPSCPAASEVGHTLVGAGVGPSLTYVPGKVYLAGPYKGSNLSIVAITAAKAGPFDLGTVVIREALKVNPETAEVSVDAGTSDPIPHIVDGIPVHLRDIRVYVDRPEFVKNPTSCTPTSTASTVLGSGTDFASEADDVPVTVTSRFQAADCASLGFKPKLALSLKGATKRAGLPALKAVVAARPGDANIGKAVVTLPQSEFLEQGHIGTTCTRVQFNAGGGNGEQCPEKSIYGHAVAVTPLLSEPLEGPVFLRSNGGERALPDLVAALHSTDINIDLVGYINSLHQKGSDVSRIRNTFAMVPDAPVTRFTLEMFGGKKGLLVNSTNLCKGTHRASSEFTGQNGRRYDTEPAVQAQCKKKGKKGKKKGDGKAGQGSARKALVLRHRVGW